MLSFSYVTLQILEQLNGSLVQQVKEQAVYKLSVYLLSYLKLLGLLKKKKNHECFLESSLSAADTVME